MHFDFTITIGQFINFCVLIGLLIRVEGWGRKLMIEHEILIQDYCVRNNIRLSSLPTRSKL